MEKEEVFRVWYALVLGNYLAKKQRYLKKSCLLMGIEWFECLLLKIDLAL
tara:strand:- start:510 stop:659 length:150 start_codon:yes stop_codon:yes gene_type:complete